MKYKYICITILSLLFYCFSNCIAVNYAGVQKQNSLEEVKRFDEAAAKHKQELRDLWLYRGGRPIQLDNATSESVARVLAVKDDNLHHYDVATYQDNTAVLFYSYESENLEAWLVDKNGIQAYHKQKILAQQINEKILNLRNSLRLDSLQLNIDNITNILLPTPITNKLASVKHLIIVPVLGLGTVPYAILQPFDDKSFLIDKMSISIAPSLFDIGGNFFPWSSKYTFRSPLIVGNPYLPPSSSWNVPPLPGAESEAQAVAKIVNSVPLIGKEATKKIVISRAKTATLLYFATHGIANSDNPLLGGFLMLSANKFEQGWWTAKEIQQMELSRTQIAILSACQTGLGKVHKAGIIGLARAFQIAGVKRVVMSLWSVDDAATNNLMQAFVKNLENDIPASALRKAMLEVRKQHPYPSEWASFVLFGTPR